MKTDENLPSKELSKNTLPKTSVANPDPGYGIQDPGWEKNQDPGCGSGMNNPDHISESLETIFGVKMLKFF
jgi:hypothetical protein